MTSGLLCAELSVSPTLEVSSPAVWVGCTDYFRDRQVRGEAGTGVYRRGVRAVGIEVRGNCAADRSSHGRTRPHGSRVGRARLAVARPAFSVCVP